MNIRFYFDFHWLLRRYFHVSWVCSLEILEKQQTHPIQCVMHCQCAHTHTHSHTLHQKSWTTWSVDCVERTNEKIKQNENRTQFNISHTELFKVHLSLLNLYFVVVVCLLVYSLLNFRATAISIVNKNGTPDEYRTNIGADSVIYRSFTFYWNHDISHTQRWLLANRPDKSITISRELF